MQYSKAKRCRYFLRFMWFCTEASQPSFFFHNCWCGSNKKISLLCLLSYLMCRNQWNVFKIVITVHEASVCGCGAKTEQHYHNRDFIIYRKLSTYSAQLYEHIKVGIKVTYALRPFSSFCAALLLMHSAAPHPEQTAVLCWWIKEPKLCPLFSLITIFFSVIMLHEIILSFYIHGWWDDSMMCVIKAAEVRIWWMANPSFTLNLPLQLSLWGIHSTLPTRSLSYMASFKFSVFVWIM